MKIRTKKEKILISEIFCKIKNFLDFCNNKRFTFEELLSIFMSNFNGEEIIKFRNSQRRRK